MTTFIPRAYPIAEIAIAVESRVPERIQEGDICGVRKPQVGIGLKEASQFLWLLIEGLEANEYSILNTPVYEPFDPTGQYNDAKTRFDKKRFCVPLARLLQVAPTINLARIRDTADDYQPFYTLDQDDHLWLTDMGPLSHEGLIFDKVTGAYL